MESSDAIILLVALASTWAMTGLIWVIQIVHYPIFDAVEQGADSARWREFAHRHTTSITFVVGPLMLTEGVTGLWLALSPPAGASQLLTLCALALMGVAYGVTAFVSAPLHGRMSDEFDPVLHRRLVSTNWIRTAAWSARAVLLAVITYTVIT